jgi:hypothetical protein
MEKILLKLQSAQLLLKEVSECKTIDIIHNNKALSISLVMSKDTKSHLKIAQKAIEYALSELNKQNIECKILKSRGANERQIIDALLD